MQTTPLSAFYDSRVRHWVLTGRGPTGLAKNVNLTLPRNNYEVTPARLRAAANDYIEANGWVSATWKQNSGCDADFSLRATPKVKVVVAA